MTRAARQTKGRFSWFPVILAGLPAVALMASLLPAVNARSVPGELGAPGGRHIGVQLTSDELGSFAPYQPGELWNGGSPIEYCAPCDLRSSSGEPAGESVQPGQEVNPATGDFSISRQLFSVATPGGTLGLTVSYDADRAANSSSAVSPFFGTGWQASLFPTEENSTDPETGYNDVTINETNGAQNVFYGNSTSETCSAMSDYSETNAYTVLTDGSYDTTQNFCAPYRTDGQVGQFANYYTVFASQDGKQITSFSTLSGLPVAIGNDYLSDLIGYSYDVTPGTDGCPSTSSFGTPGSCDVVEDSAGRQDVVTLGAPSGYPDANDYVLQVNDPLGYTFGWAWVPDFVDPQPASIQMDDPSLAWQWDYGYSSSTETEMTSVTDPDGDSQHVGYNSSFQVTSLSDFANENVTDYSYENTTDCIDECLESVDGSPDSQQTIVDYPDGEVDIDQFNQGLLDQNQFGGGTVPNASEVYYSYSYPTTQDDPIGETIDAENDAGGPIEFPSSPWEVETDPFGDVISLTTPDGADFSAQYISSPFNEPCWSAPVALPSDDEIDDCTPPGGSNAATYSYNLVGMLTSATDPDGYTTNYGYYNDGALCWTEPPTVTGSGSSCGAPYDSPSGAPAGASAVSYDIYGEPAYQYQAYGTASQTTQSATYDADGEMTSSYPPDAYAEGMSPGSPNSSYETTYTNDGLRLESETTPLGRTTSYTYDAMGNVLTETDPTGVTTSAYDTDGRLCWSNRGSSAIEDPPACSSPPSQSTAYTYNYDTSAVATETNPDGDTTSYTYGDVAFPTLPTEVADPMSAAVTYDQYDMTGNLCVTGPQIPATYQSDHDNSPCTYVPGDTWNVNDPLGNLILSEDAGTSSTSTSGNVTSYTFGNAAFPMAVTSVTNGLDDKTVYGYNSDGDVTSVTNENSSESTFSSYSIGYNDDDQECYINVSSSSDSCTSVSNVLGNHEYTYNARGQLATTLDFNGSATTPTSIFSYDNDNNLTEEVNDNDQATLYAYDVAGDLTCVGYPVVSGANCSNPGSTTNTVVDYGYSSAGQLTSTTDWLGNTTSYGYSSNGRDDLTGITYPSSTDESVNYGYDADSILTSADYAGPAVGSEDQSFTPDADGLLTSTSQLGGYSSSPTYNDYDEVQTNTDPGQSSANTYGYNPNGTIAFDTPPTGSATDYSYEGADQLQTVTTGSATTTYAENPVGERCWSAPGTVSDPSCSSPPSAATSYGWDAEGQLCWTGVTTAQNACGSTPAGATAYTYDGQGLLSSETTPTTTGWSTPSSIDGSKDLSAISCPSTSFCMAIDTSGDWLKYNGTTWSTPSSIGDSYTIEGLSCTSASFCLAVDEEGYDLTFNGTGWTARSLYDTVGIPTRVSCVASGLSYWCMAVDSDGRAYVDNGGSWSHSTVDSSDELEGVSCVSSSFCMVIDLEGNAFEWNGSRWTTYSGALHSEALSISCASSSFCEAASANGWTATYTGSWSTSTQASGAPEALTISCASSTVCKGIASGGDVYSYNGSSWSAFVKIDSHGLAGVSCPTTSFCIAVDNSGNELNYSAPSSNPGGTWSQPYSVDGRGGPTRTSCTSSFFCMAVDDSGDALSYNGSSWTAPSDIDGSSDIVAVSCTASSFCMAVDSSGYDLTYNGTSWTKATSAFDPTGNPTDISCVSSNWCMAVDSSGADYIYGYGIWTEHSADGDNQIMAVACPADNWCMAIDVYGTAITYNGSSWSTTSGVIPGGYGLDISCASESSCAAVGWDGYADYYNGSWGTAEQVDSTSLNRISCPVAGLCYALDNDGRVVAYSDSSWSTPVDIDGSAGFGAISCVGTTFCEALDDSGSALNFNENTHSQEMAWDLVSGDGLPRIIDDGTNAYIYGPSLFGSSAPVEQISLTNDTVDYLSSAPSGVQLTFDGDGGYEINDLSYTTYGKQSDSGSPVAPFGFEGGYTEPTGLIYLTGRYYDPTTAQFLSVDPDLPQTGQPYSYAGDDPLNRSDPSGLCALSDQECVNLVLAAWIVDTDDWFVAGGDSLTLTQQLGYIVASNYAVTHPLQLSYGNWQGILSAEGIDIPWNSLPNQSFSSPSLNGPGEQAIDAYSAGDFSSGGSASPGPTLNCVGQVIYGDADTDVGGELLGGLLNKAIDGLDDFVSKVLPEYLVYEVIRNCTS